MANSSHTLTTYHFSSASSTFSTFTTSKPLSPNSILIKTTHSGICFTDVHAKDSGCGLGHEGVGHITAIGSSITQFQVGQRVGWGWLHTSCGHCKTCVTGYRQYCAQARGFAFSDQDQGAFSDYRIIDAAFAYAIPAGIESLHAAPLMCAGASVFEALHAGGATSNSHIGVVGIGGLGHMAILFAKAMGCEISAISATASKRDDALALGTDHFFESSQEMQNEGAGIDVLLITSNAVPELSTLLPLLERRATIVLMTIQGEALEVPYMAFVLPGHRLIASTEASRENHIAMLEFAARKNIVPWVEEFEMNEKGIGEAFGKLEGGGMRYRGVLVRKD